MLKTILRSDDNSPTCQGIRTPDEALSTPLLNALPEVPESSTLRSSLVIRHDSDQKESISRRRNTRRALSPIRLSQTAMPSPIPQTRERAQVRRFANNVRLTPTHRNIPAVIDREFSTCATDHVPVAKPSKAHRSKRRRLGSDADAAATPISEVHTTSTSMPTGKAAYACLEESDEGRDNCAAGVIPPDIVNKINRVGSVEVLEELKGNLSRLRAGAHQKPLTPNHETRVLCVRNSLETHRSNEVTRALSNLRAELEVAEMGEQLCRFRKRVALSRFYDFYEMAQENPTRLLSQDHVAIRKMGRSSADNTTRRPAPRKASLVLNRIVDLMFPDTILDYEDVGRASKEAQRTLTKRYRRAAVQKVGDWRKNGKPWSVMIKRFGQGVLLLLPKCLSDEK